MKILVDTNVLLDIFLNREKLYQESFNTIEKAIKAHDTIYFSSACVKDIYYFVFKYTHNKHSSLKAVVKLLEFSKLLKVDNINIIEAIASEMSDFEDAIIDSVAFHAKADCIITRNIKDYAKARSKVVTPKQYLELN